MKKILAASVAVLLASPAFGAVIVTPGATEGSQTDALNGAQVTNTSPILPGFSAQDAFGSVTPGGPYAESQAGGHVIFGVDQPGFLNFIDFNTAAPVTLSSLSVYVSGDLPSNPDYRSFRTVELFAGTSAGALTSLGQANLPVGGAYTANFTLNAPTSYQFFRFEGTNFSNGGARLLEIDGTAVPEPATWAMMIGGFGMVGGAMRYRRRKTQIAFATA